jgi:hypothetical protein
MRIRNVVVFNCERPGSENVFGFAIAMLLGTRRHRTNSAHHSQHLRTSKQQRLTALTIRLEMAALDELVDGLAAAIAEEFGDFAGREQ